MSKVKRTERGWAGHFILSDRCLFRRNTLLKYKDQKIVVSTVGCCLDVHSSEEDRKFIEIGHDRYYETMAFHSILSDTVYFDIDVEKTVNFSSKCAIKAMTYTSDLEANEMHEAVVAEITDKLINNTVEFL